MGDRITQILQQKAGDAPSNQPPALDYSQMYNPALLQSMQQPQVSGAEQVKMAAAQGHPESQQVVAQAKKWYSPEDPRHDGIIQFWHDYPETLDPSNSYQMMTTGAQYARTAGAQMPSIQQIGIQDLGNIASGRGTNVLGLTQDAEKIAANGGVNGKLPASVILANEMQDALARGDTQRYNALLLASKSMDKGITTDANGNPIAMAGYGEALGKNAYGEKFGATSGENAADLAQKPAIESGVVTAQKTAEQNVQRQANYTKAQSALVGFQQQADIVDKTIDKAVKKISGWSTGYGSMLSGLPNTDARELKNYLDTIKANVGFDKLQQMRENSPTGGALGQISDFENQLLQAVNGALDPGQSDQLKDNLLIIKELYPKVIQEKARAFQQDYGNISPIGNNPVSPKKQGGVLHTDANGNKAIVYPDGSYEEVP